mgnify:CR=1 FL=1
MKPTIKCTVFVTFQWLEFKTIQNQTFYTIPISLLFLGFDLAHGGHLTHGSPVNFSGRLYEAHFYGVSKETGRLDYENIKVIAEEVQPQMLIAGASAYSRDIDFERFRVFITLSEAVVFL